MATQQLTLSTTYKAILNSALDMKLASIKRAMKADKNPRFKEIYLLEERETLEVQNWINTAKTAD